MKGFMVDGHSVYYADGGLAWQADKPLLCLVHGAAMDHTVWTLYSRYFARAGYNVMAPDLCGHGRSKGPLLPSIEAMAQWLNSLLNQVDTERVVLAGHSMGSLVALEAAAQRPDRISHLALLGTSMPMRVGDALLDAAKENHSDSRDMVAIFGHAYASRLGGNPVSGISVVNAALALMEQAGDDVMYADMLASHNYENGNEAARSVSGKTTLILGALDRMTPVKAGRSLAASFESAELVVLKECGHMMMAEQPEETLQAMIAAFKR